METVRKYEGKGNFDTLCRKIYAKYVYKGTDDNQEYFDNNYDNLIENANTTEEIEELENIIVSLYFEGSITPEQYTEFMDKLENRKNDIL